MFTSPRDIRPKDSSCLSRGEESENGWSCDSLCVASGRWGEAGAHPPGTAWAAVSDSHGGCLMALLWRYLHPLQCDNAAGFAGLLGWVLQEIERGF